MINIDICKLICKFKLTEYYQKSPITIIIIIIIIHRHSLFEAAKKTPDQDDARGFIRYSDPVEAGDVSKKTIRSRSLG